MQRGASPWRSPTRPARAWVWASAHQRGGGTTWYTDVSANAASLAGANHVGRATKYVVSNKKCTHQNITQASIGRYFLGRHDNLELAKDRYLYTSN